MLIAAFLFQGGFAVLVVGLIGLIKECWDHFWGSGFCWLDMLANAFGIVAGSAVYLLAGFAFEGVILKLM